MGTMVTRSETKKRRRLEEERADRISRLPDVLLGGIVSLLPTKDAARTQLLSSRWRHICRSAPLNLELDPHGPFRIRDADAEISRILSLHPAGPCRRLSIRIVSLELIHLSAAAFDRWLCSPLLDGGLQDLGLHGSPNGDDDDDAGGALRFFPVLERLSLSHVTISEASLHALLAGCHALRSLLLVLNNGFSSVRIVSSCLRSIGVHPRSRDKMFQHLVIEDAPCLERLLLFGIVIGVPLDISVISAPKLSVLGKLFDGFPKLQFDTTVFQAFKAGGENEWCHQQYDLIDTHDIGLKKIVLKNYRGDTSHVMFAKFFVLHARMLQLMVLDIEGTVAKEEIEGTEIKCEWIEKQHELLQTKDRASRGARFDFVCHDDKQPDPLGPEDYEQAHELSIPDPFVRFRDWYCH
ncbi:hypothetical protein HU200_016446 [Digitaria exilis]|uniref:F-box domain-containing protein n=1 Tax=Digitaria exilis TaxID=1010633 RepID=A0A835F8X1_9POAL|nr:hypothetical protein HU200_016446 [Digitaria exilis]